MGNKHTISDLHQMQSLSLSAKIRMTQNRIRGWVEEYGEDGVYLSFSGGKDSTVLLHMARQLYPGLKAVFVDTGLEYPEVRRFVKCFDNVDWLRPAMTFKQVIEKYGYPFIGKEISDSVSGARKYLKKLRERQDIPADGHEKPLPYVYCMADMLGMDRRDRKNEDYQKLKRGFIQETDENMPIRFLQFYGMVKHKEKGVETGEYSRRYDKRKYQFLLTAPFEISAGCCEVMKKRPIHKYARNTGRKPITAQMASESQLRTMQWLKNGCNGFGMKSPISNPMSFWTEQDVLLYVTLYITPEFTRNWELAVNGHGSGRKKARKFLRKWNYSRTGIAPVYGEIIPEGKKKGKKAAGQARAEGCDIFDLDRPLLKTTGCQRTGCMFCGYGCHLEKSPGRFERMKLTHPKQYEFIMKPWSEGGLGYKDVIDWLNEHGNLKIRY